MPLIADSDKSLAAASLIRAGICDDADTGVLILRQHGAYAGDEDSKNLSELTLAVTSLAVRVLLSANGYNVAKTMKVIDQWIENYGREAASRV
jgi:rhamnose utilization protein RhaD (predicted bifunctional aldolase and dehydrogenase)